MYRRNQWCVVVLFVLGACATTGVNQIRPQGRTCAEQTAHLIAGADPLLAELDTTRSEMEAIKASGKVDPAYDRIMDPSTGILAITEARLREMKAAAEQAAATGADQKPDSTWCTTEEPALRASFKQYLLDAAKAEGIDLNQPLPEEQSPAP